MSIFQYKPGSSYYKLRIILTFSAVTAVLVILLSQLSYVFIRKIYLEQIEEQVLSSVKSISKQIDNSHLNMLDLGMPTESTSYYFTEMFANNLSDDSTNTAFIFNADFKVYVHSQRHFKAGREYSQLSLFRDEITKIDPGESAMTMPFKGDDSQWYLLSFIRMNENFWLAVRESAQRLEKVEDFEKIFWLIGIGGTILTIITGWFLSRSITQPLDKLVTFSNQIGKGDFNVPMPKKLRGEIKQLAVAMEKMRDNLSNNQKEKENMLAQIAHEIRNPLGGIELLASLTKEDLAKGQVKEEYLNKILSEINSLKSLISSFLSYSRPSRAEISLTSISTAVEEVRNIFQSEIQKKNVSLHLNIDSSKIWFDSSHLKQILTNLVSNSLEAISIKGEINIHSFIKENVMHISISDNGTGISEINLKQIFNPFYTTKKDGTGLGLAICKKLCAENNAQLLVESNIGSGTKFTILKELTNE